MKILLPFVAVIALVVIAFVGAQVSQEFFGIVVPYLAFAIFVVGFILKVLKWGRSPVPYRIPTTAGQMKSFAPWIKQNKFDNPSDRFGVFVRMALEVLTFRSLFRNTKTELHPGTKLAYGSEKFLWLAGLAFHWSFLIIFIRHFRFFMLEIPWPVQMIEMLDSFLQIGAPLLYMTDLILVGAVTFLFLRRVMMPSIKYISLPADYFPLFLILGIALSGILMRYFTKTHIVGVKELVLGLLTFSPAIPEGIGPIFYVHLFLVSTLLAYFPMSKLMHMGGVFLSPTRNMANNSREVRHINPWNHPVHVHTYAEYEDEFREKMKKAGLPVEKE
jgi:nitrate reductase gamma subunit